MFDLRVAVLCFAAAAGAIPVSAQEAQVAFGSVNADPTLPVEVTSETLNVNQEDGSAEFIGDVIVIQGEMRLTAERVLVIYNQERSAIERMEATENVVLVSPPDAAEGDWAEYTIDSGVIEMKGNVLLTQGPSIISGDQMIANLTSGTATMSGRVKTILQQGGKLMNRPELSITEGSSGLKIEKLRKSYRKKTVIRDVSMELNRSEVVALLGPNGSGKTTTFYSVAGLVFPEAGTVEIDGQNVTTLPMYRRARLGIGYLPQEMSIFRGMSVEDNIASVLDITVKHAHRRKERLEELLSDFSIEHLRRAPALALSGGERRRVEIARCLAADPKYLLLDEPFAGVDPISVGDIRHLVADLKKRGIGVLITDHNVRETLEIVDRAYILHDGQVLMSGTPDEVVENENVRRVYLGENFRIS